MNEQDRKKWLEWRRGGVGGSEIAGLIGISSRNTPLSIYLDKVGEGLPFSVTEKMLWGQRLEPTIIEEAFTKLGIPTPFRAVGINSQKNHMIASLDACEMRDGRVATIVDAKNVEFDDGFGDDGTSDIPEMYAAQLQHYMHVFDCEMSYLAVLIRGCHLKTYPIPRDRTIGDYLEDCCSTFFRDHVLPRVPPPPSNYNECSVRWRRSTEKMLQASLDTIDKIQKLKSQKDEMKRLEDEVLTLKKELASELRESEGFLDGDDVLITWKSNKAGNRVFVVK